MEVFFKEAFGISVPVPTWQLSEAFQELRHQEIQHSFQEFRPDGRRTEKKKHAVMLA